MGQTITIPLETYKCLREHLNQANEIFKSLGADSGSLKASGAPPKKGKKEKITDYENLITSGNRLKKSDALKR